MIFVTFFLMSAPQRQRPRIDPYFLNDEYGRSICIDFPNEGRARAYAITEEGLLDHEEQFYDIEFSHDEVGCRTLFTSVYLCRTICPISLCLAHSFSLTMVVTSTIRRSITLTSL